MAETQSAQERREACWRETPNTQERHAPGRAIQVEKEEWQKFPEEAELAVRRKAKRMLRVLRENMTQG